MDNREKAVQMADEMKDHLQNGIIPFWKKLRDDEFGGIYWSLKYDGTPEDTTKHTYNQAFCIYALASYYEASGDSEALDLAFQLFHLIEDKCTDDLGYMEAYTELLRVTGNEEVKERLMWIMDTVADKVYNPVLKRQEVFFDREYHSIIDLYSYGHDIETAWLLDRGVSVLGSLEYRDKMHAITKVLTRQIYDIAFDGHSLSNECDKGKVDTNRVWWVQAETVVGFVNGWQQDPKHEEYLEGALLVWEFIKEHVIDKREGSEWFWLVTQEELLNRKNVKSDFYNGVYDRYEYPVLTREHIPLTWRYDLNKETNPYFMERLGINAVMNSGAIELNGKYYLVARIEGNDRKSFFGVAESDNGVDGFRFWDYPILLDDTCPEETNVYDMRLTKHEDGYIYGVFCSESKDTTVNDLSAAVAAAGIVRTKDLKHWERLDNLVTLNSSQQRNVVLHPEFVNGKYAFYTRPMDDFIETGSILHMVFVTQQPDFVMLFMHSQQHWMILQRLSQSHPDFSLDQEERNAASSA